MLFNSGTTTNSIVYRLNRNTGANNTIYPLADKASDVNEGLDKYWHLAMVGSGTWQIDDSNQTDLPISTADLVSGQQDYTLPSDLMIIEKIFAKDSGGSWNELAPVDITQTQEDLGAKNIWILPSGNSGSPTKYDKKANSIFLDPIPNYNSTSGLKISFKRGPSYIISSDTTKAPGIPSIYHPYLVDYATWVYLGSKLSNQSLIAKYNVLTIKLANWEKTIKEYYAYRPADEKKRLIPLREYNR